MLLGKYLLQAQSPRSMIMHMHMHRMNMEICYRLISFEDVPIHPQIYAALKNL
jgi:hypothetical protein